MEGLGECWKSVGKKASVRCRFFSTLLFLSGSLWGEKVEGVAPCGRLQGGLDHVYSAGGSHKGCSKIPEVWEYVSGFSPYGSIECLHESTIFFSLRCSCLRHVQKHF